MNLEETRKRILEDDEFVIKQLDTLALYYNLKHTIRWSHNRGNEDLTESVAEHVYGMHLLIDYFIPLIDAASQLDKEWLHSLATWHDMAEAVVSDMTTRTKTKEHMDAEKKAEAELVSSTGNHMKTLLERVFAEYDPRITPESKFIKAIDKIEPLFHLYFLTTKGFGSKSFDLGWPAEKYQAHRRPYLESFDILLRFDDILFEKTKHLHPS
jgi:5'-deoxynucleotidase YfbR-like HD superfamily hydrolase